MHSLSFWRPFALAAHHHANVPVSQGGIGQVGSGKRLRHAVRGCGKARHVAIAADVEKVFDLVRLQNLEDFLALARVGLAARGALCRFLR